MKYCTFFFLLMNIFYLINYRMLYYLLQYFSEALAEEKSSANPRVILLNKDAIIFLLYLTADFFYLFFCLWLLLTDKYWQPGSFLFLLTALDAYCLKAKVAGTYEEDPESGYLYHQLWWRCFFPSSFLLSSI